jgi:hypothetical protein
MANTIRPYTGDGTTVLYPVDFDLGYIRKSHIYVYLEGNDHTVQLDYTYISDVQIQLVTPVINGTVFNIRRVVPRDSLVNDYEDGAALHEGNLDNSFKQALMIQEELSDGFANLDGSFNVLADLDLKDTYKVTNSIDPVDEGDLVNLSYLDTQIDTLTTHVDTVDALKMDKVPAATTDNIIIFDSAGNAQDSGKRLDEIGNGGSAIKDTPPTFPAAGDRWTRCSDMKGFIYYVDDTSAQWVEDRPSYGTDTIGDVAQAYIFDTVADYSASTIVFPIGKTVHLKDRQADFTVIAGTGTGNNGDIIESVAVNQTITLIEPITGERLLSAHGMSVNNTAAQNKAIWDGAILTSTVNDVMVLPSGVLLTSGVFRAKHRSIRGYDTIIDATGESNAGNKFGTLGTVDQATVILEGDKPTLTGLVVSADLEEGQLSVTFTTAHGLSFGDIFILYDDNTFSYSSYRDAYKAGQYCEVASVTNSTQVRLVDQIYQDYTAANLTVYTTNMSTCFAEGITAIAPGLSAVNVHGFLTSNVRESTVNNVGGTRSNDVSFYVYNCYKVTGEDVKGHQFTEKAAGNTVTSQYGINVTNSLHCHFSGDFIAYRHAGSYGASSQQITITTRFCSISGGFSNLIGSAGPTIGCCDFHGNTEYSKFNGTTSGGCAVDIAGNHNTVNLKSLISKSSNGVAIYFSELTGLDHEINGSFKVLGDSTVLGTKFSPVDFGRNGGAFGQDIPDDSRETLKFNFKLDCPIVTERVIFIDNNDGVSGGIMGDWRIDCTNLEVVAPNALLIWDVRTQGTGSLPKFKGLTQQGFVTIAVGGGGTLAATTINFDHDFPKIPVVLSTLRQSTTGTDTLGSQVQEETKVDYKHRVYANSGNFTAGNVSAVFRAELTEF